MTPATQLRKGRWLDLGTEADQREPGGRRTKVLVTIESAHHASPLIGTAAAFARTSHSEILAVHVAWVPPQLPLSAAARFETDARPVMQAMHRVREHVLDVPIRIVLTAGRRTDDVIIGASRRDDVPIVVIPWEPDRGPTNPRARIDVGRVMRRAQCRVVALRQRCPSDAPARIVLAVRPHNRSAHTITAAAALARHHGATVQLLSALPAGVDRRAEIDTRMWQVRVEGELATAGIPHHRLQRAVVTGGDLDQALENHTHADDLILLGVPTGLGPFTWARRRRLVRGFEEVDRTIALYRPQPSLLRRIGQGLGGDDT